MAELWPGGAALAVNLCRDLLQQAAVLRGGEDEQGELDGVGGGLRPGPEQVALEEKQLAPSETPQLAAPPPLNLLEIEVCETVGREALSQVSLSLPADLLVDGGLPGLALSKHHNIRALSSG